MSQRERLRTAALREAVERTRAAYDSLAGQLRLAQAAAMDEGTAGRPEVLRHYLEECERLRALLGERLDELDRLVISATVRPGRASADDPER